jgi:DNA invertase Pin-like site-specific DNA recombinase
VTMIGYARVSTLDQDPALQLDALKAAGCDHLYVEYASGRKFSSRPQLDLCLRTLRSGDTLVVWAIDRLGRDVIHLVSLVNELAAQGVAFRSLREGIIDTSSSMGGFMLGLFALLAEVETTRLRERTMEGLAAARARGHYGGRPPVLVGAKLAAAQHMYDRGETLATIARTLEVSRTTVTRVMGGGRVRALQAVTAALGDHSDLRAGKVDRWAMASALYATREHRIADLARALHLPQRQLAQRLRLELLDADAQRYAAELEGAG